MKFTQMQDDKGIWRKQGTSNPEVAELIQQIKGWEQGKTYEVNLDKPFRSLKSILKREFKGINKVSVKKKDESNVLWFVRIDPLSVKEKEKELKNNAQSN